MQAYIGVWSTGEAPAELGAYKDADFDVRKAYLATNIKGRARPAVLCAAPTDRRADVIRMFGPEVILLWSALLMKKRVTVYAEKLGILLKLIR